MQNLDKKLSARIPHELDAKLMDYAKKHNRSVNNVINIALQQFLNQEKIENK